VNFEDATVVRLADPATRGALFDDASLEQICRAGYDAAALALEGPFGPVFDDLHLGFSDDPPATVDGAWSRAGGTDRTELQLRVHGLGLAPARVDAVWRGAISAHATPPAGIVSAADTRWGPAGSDGGSAQRTVNGTVTLQFTSTGPATPVPVLLPLAALVLVRDVGVSIAQLLADSNAVRERLDATGLERTTPPGLPVSHPVVVVWVVPSAMFDDPDWPGGAGGQPDAERAARREAAGRWLADQGIGLAVVGP
jgi:hypothetical protein